MINRSDNADSVAMFASLRSVLSSHFPRAFFNYRDPYENKKMSYVPILDMDICRHHSYSRLQLSYQAFLVIVCNSCDAEIFMYKPWRTKCFFFNLKGDHKCLSKLFPLHLKTYVMGL